MRHPDLGGVIIALLWLLPFSSLGQATHGKSFPSFPFLFNEAVYHGIQWRHIGPYRGGRVGAVCGVPRQPLVYYAGTAGGGLWKTTDAGLTWTNISDGYFRSGSVGAIAVAETDPNIIYAGMGEHAVRGVMSSHGDGLYRSLDAGKTWTYLGLPDSRHIAAIRIHPRDPDLVYVAVQGAAFGPCEDRGVYKTTDGGRNWRKVLYVDENTGACDLAMDVHNPRVLYAGMWDHRRFPWMIRSGGPGSGIYKSIDGGDTWEKLGAGLPAQMGKIGVDVSAADPNIVYANIEAEKGGVFRSNDGGKTWRQTSQARITIGRAWYYTEIVADPVDPETVYVLNAPLLRSIDGGKTFEPVPNPHTDQHGLWINPHHPETMILGNDGGACITWNGGRSWSTQYNQPTAQIYRVITDQRFPYAVYGAQQDHSPLAIPSRSTFGEASAFNMLPVPGGESAFIAFDPRHPERLYATGYQGNISVVDRSSGTVRDIMAYPATGLATPPRQMKFRFNWNAPLVVSPQDPQVIYHGANVVLRTADGGSSWEVISPDLTRNEPRHQGAGGTPFTNEGAGAEVYNTLSYLACSPHQEGVIWAGSDDGLVHLTRDGGVTWTNVTPPKAGEGLVNCIEISPHDPAGVYVAITRYKFNNLTPLIYHSADFGKNWSLLTTGIGEEDFVRVVREDPQRPGLLYAGTEHGLYLSFDKGKFWHRFQLNLPVCPITDLAIRDNDLVAATAGRGFWILDDLGAIQQSAGELVNGHPRLFRPKPACRFFEARPAESSSEEAGPPTPAGMYVDYYLPRQMDSCSLYLEILDTSGLVIRKFATCRTLTDVRRYEGGPPPVPLLPAAPGVNRFNWDLRREPLPAIPGVFLPGAYEGSMVAPGDYTLRLVCMSDTLIQSCRVMPDPRIAGDAGDYAGQQEALLAIENAICGIRTTALRFRGIKKQMENLDNTLAAFSGTESLREYGRSILEKINSWERVLIQPDLQTQQDVINFPGGLDAELADLRQRIDNPDPRLTNGMQERLRDLISQWESLESTWKDLLRADMAEYNRRYREGQFPVLFLPGEIHQMPEQEKR